MGEAAESATAFLDAAGTSQTPGAVLLAELDPRSEHDEVEVLIGGKPKPPIKDCEHRTLFEQVVFGILEDDGEIVGWEALLKVRCGACGVPFDFDPDTARRPNSVPHGVVVALAPVPE